MSVLSPCQKLEYIDDLWFLLHHSENEDRVVLGLTLYLDDSGSDYGSRVVTCGGAAMSRIQFKWFSERWESMYRRFSSSLRIEPPLHMSDFVGMGKYAALAPEFKRHIFERVSRLVNEQKLYSLSVAVPQFEFQSQLSEEVRKVLIGPYAYAFSIVVLAHQHLSEKELSRGPLRASYMVDRGFGHQQQLNEAHKVIVDFEKALGGFRHTGALATGSDDNVPALQAADAIAWASRKIQLDGTLPEGFEPLGDLLSKRNPHMHISIPNDAIEMLAKPINAWIKKYGEIPKLTDFLVRRIDGYAVKLNV